jgi:hypothetical protein
MAKLKKVVAISRFIKNSKGFSMNLAYYVISWNCFLSEKSWTGSMDHGPWLALGPRWTHDHACGRSGPREVAAIARRERGGRRGSHQRSHLAVGWRHSTEADGGAPMGRWFYAR